MPHPQVEGEEAVVQLKLRMKALVMRLAYQTWLDSFKKPFTYEPLTYEALGLERDYTLHFGVGPGATKLKVPVSLMCSISSPLREIIADHFFSPRQTPVFEKTDAYAFWWLMNFLRSNCTMPDAEGLARVLRMAHKFKIQPIAHISRTYLSTVLNLSSFPYVLNAAVETNDDEFLAQCSCMVAAWTDELLASPTISVLSYEAMLHLLDDSNLSPSSELLVFNAVVNWAGKRESYSVEVTVCMRKVRFLLFKVDEFVTKVLPSGMFPVNDANAMIRILRKTPKQRDTVSFLYDLKQQRTPRPVLLGTLVVGQELHEREQKCIDYEATNREEEVPICYLNVNKHVLLRRVNSASFRDEKGGKLKLDIIGGTRMSCAWKHCSSTFEKPIPLEPETSYTFSYVSDTGRVEKEICNNFKGTVGDVTFTGVSFCAHFSLEFATFQAADAESIDKVWSYMKPDHNEEVMLHQYSVVDRLIRLQGTGEAKVNRSPLKAMREKLFKKHLEDQKVGACGPEESEGSEDIDHNTGASGNESERLTRSVQNQAIRASRAELKGVLDLDSLHVVVASPGETGEESLRQEDHLGKSVAVLRTELERAAEECEDHGDESRGALGTEKERTRSENSANGGDSILPANIVPWLTSTPDLNGRWDRMSVEAKLAESMKEKHP